jgi:hypothetical protein
MRFLIFPLVLFCTLPLAACPSDPSPVDPIVEICGDGIDNDNDGQKDCDDSECANLFACKNPTLDGGVAHDAGPVADTGSSLAPDGGSTAQDAGSSTPADTGPLPLEDEICDDGIDNDGDLMTDCADLDCYGVGDCPAGPEDCEDEQDNNNDNLVDCADPLCADDPACGGEPLGRTCPDLAMCLEHCPDDACRDECNVGATEETLALLGALLDCDAGNGCGGDLGCLTDHCPTQLAACQGDMPG